MVAPLTTPLLFGGRSLLVLRGLELGMRVSRTGAVRDGTLQYPVDEPVLDCFLRTHETVAVHIVLNLLQRLTRVLS